MAGMNLRRVCNGLAMALLIGVSTTQTTAQIGGLGDQFARELRPDFLRRDMQLINDRLELDEAQREIIQSVLLDYIAAFDEAARGARQFQRRR